MLYSSAVTGVTARLIYKSAETAVSKNSLLKYYRKGFFHFLKYPDCRVQALCLLLNTVFWTRRPFLNRLHKIGGSHYESYRNIPNRNVFRTEGIASIGSTPQLSSMSRAVGEFSRTEWYPAAALPGQREQRRQCRKFQRWIAAQRRNAALRVWGFYHFGPCLWISKIYEKTPHSVGSPSVSLLCSQCAPEVSGRQDFCLSVVGDVLVLAFLKGFWENCRLKKWTDEVIQKMEKVPYRLYSLLLGKRGVRNDLIRVMKIFMWKMHY